MNNEDFNQTQSVAAAFAHELASPLGAMGHALELLAEQLRACMPKERLVFFEEGLKGSMAPICASHTITDKKARRKAQAIAKAPAMEKLTTGLAADELEQALKCFDLGFSLHCALLGSESGMKILKNLRHWSDWKDLMEKDVNVADTLSSAWGIVAHRCKNIKMHWNVAEAPTLTANPYALTQAWANIILNAAQTSNEEVSMRIAVTADANAIHITFENDGSRFADGLKLFEKGQTTKKSGSGLGLHLCREVIERHQGTISAANTDSGVQFHITLPIA